MKCWRTIRKVIKNRKCFKRFDSKPKSIIQAFLSVDDIKEAAVNKIVGTDYADPLLLRGGKKGWEDIFTCTVYITIHLEIATYLSTANFLQAFSRIIARSGRPAIGKNFTGVENLLKKIEEMLLISTAQLRRSFRNLILHLHHGG